MGTGAAGPAGRMCMCERVRCVFSAHHLVLAVWIVTLRPNMQNLEKGGLHTGASSPTPPTVGLHFGVLGVQMTQTVPGHGQGVSCLSCGWSNPVSKEGLDADCNASDRSCGFHLFLYQTRPGGPMNPCSLLLLSHPAPMYNTSLLPAARDEMHCSQDSCAPSPARFLSKK